MFLLLNEAIVSTNLTRITLFHGIYAHQKILGTVAAIVRTSVIETIFILFTQNRFELNVK